MPEAAHPTEHAKTRDVEFHGANADNRIERAIIQQWHTLSNSFMDGGVPFGNCRMDCRRRAAALRATAPTTLFRAALQRIVAGGRRKVARVNVRHADCGPFKQRINGRSPHQRINCGAVFGHRYLRAEGVFLRHAAATAFSEAAAKEELDCTRSAVGGQECVRRWTERVEHIRANALMDGWRNEGAHLAAEDDGERMCAVGQRRWLRHRRRRTCATPTELCRRQTPPHHHLPPDKTCRDVARRPSPGHCR